MVKTFFFGLQPQLDIDIHRTRSRLLKRHVIKGDTTKPRSGCHREISPRVPPFLATPLYVANQNGGPLATREKKSSLKLRRFDEY